MKISILSLLLVFIFVSCNQNESGTIAYQIPEKKLIPEGIAWSEKHNKFFLSSIHLSKIIEIDAQDGSYKDFINSRNYGFLSGIGLQADDESNRLYAIGTSTSSDDKGSGLFVFNMDDGRLVKKYMADTTEKHFFNDLTIDNEKNVYITDTQQSKIYFLNRKNDKLTTFLKGKEVLYPNGIVISSDNGKLYIASHVNGIRIFDLTSGEFLNDIDSTDATKGIDGLKYYNNTLIGVQNGYRDSIKIVQFILDKEGKQIVDKNILDINNPHFNVPTTGVVVCDKYYCIANSQLPYLDQEKNEILDTTKLKETHILRYNLN